MYDRDMLLDVLHQTLEAVQRVIKRFEPVGSVAFFTDTDDGMEKLDAICMLICIFQGIPATDSRRSRPVIPFHPGQ